MKTFDELQIGDKIFIWDYQKKILDIGIITDIIRKNEYIVWCYDSIFESIDIAHSIALGLNQCIGAYTYNITSFSSNTRSLPSYYLVSTFIDPILNLIEENENI